jgi:hypothetical protein
MALKTSTDLTIERYVRGYMLTNEAGEDVHFVDNISDVDVEKYGARSCLMDVICNKEVKFYTDDVIGKAGGRFGKRMQFIQQLYEVEDLIYKDLIMNGWG